GDHGISMKVLAKASRLVGVDQLHIGTVVGKMSESEEEVLENLEAIRGPMYGLRPVLPVASGGLHPALVSKLLKVFGVDLVIQAGGGIHGHPLGTLSGARAMRQAVEATLEGYSLEEYARGHEELATALKTWLEPEAGGARDPTN
ncbi:ribulose-bisphosphate carboxylase large subunit, partial [Candidatus Bathyarchaeota archaeon]|nr:ribulose-bisphosphate carboxylase large subunit [Candidatus Bathyarchaeota archaeon]